MSLTYDLIRNVVPYSCHPRRAPLRLSTDEPLQSIVAVARRTRYPSGLQFREVRLEEADLMLAVDAWSIGR